MSPHRLAPAALALLLLWLLNPAPSAAAPANPRTLRIATYNLQNYLDAPSGTRPAKTAASRAKIRESIRALAPDVLALQEMGAPSALAELRESLRGEGLDFTDWELVQGWDTNIHVAVLSRYPIAARRPRTNDSFALFGRQFRVKRGFAEVDIAAPGLPFTLITAHLKSKLSAFEADEQELRDEEAALLRGHIDAILEARPTARLVVLGDFNDTPDSKPVRTIIGRRHALLDARPCEPNGDDQPNNNPRYAAPRITWTHFFARDDSFRRIDYILLSRSLAPYVVSSETRVLRLSNWGVGSDHRPIVVTLSLP